MTCYVEMRMKTLTRAGAIHIYFDQTSAIRNRLGLKEFDDDQLAARSPSSGD